jgi:hypothetical protein
MLGIRSARMPLSQISPDAPAWISRLEQPGLADVIPGAAPPIVTTGPSSRSGGVEARGVYFRARLQVRGRSAVIADWTTEPAR